MTACSQTWEVACALLRSMPQSSIQPDIVCLNAALKACEVSSVWDQGLALLAFKQIPSVVTFNTAISACAKAQEWQWSLQLLKDMVLEQVVADAATFNAAISATEKKWQICLALWQEMPKIQLQRDVTTLTSAVSACAGATQFPNAVALLFDAETALRPNAVTYAKLLSFETNLSSDHLEQCSGFWTSLSHEALAECATMYS